MTTEERREYHREWQRKRRAADPEKAKATYREWVERKKLSDPDWWRRRQEKHAERYRVNADSEKQEARDRDRERYANDPAYREAKKRRVASWRMSNPDKVRDNNQRRGSEYWRAGMLKKYDLTPEQYQAIWTAQDGVCAICRKPEVNKYRGKPRALAVDHDHEKGLRRGLLCSKCNRGIGHFGHDAAKLLAAAGYLTRWSGQPLIYREPPK